MAKKPTQRQIQAEKEAAMKDQIARSSTAGEFKTPKRIRDLEKGQAFRANCGGHPAFLTVLGKTPDDRVQAKDKDGTEYKFAGWIEVYI